MKKDTQLGFSAIELMITLFIAVGFFTTGFQIYNLIIIDGNNARTQARANNIVNDYLAMYEPDSSVSCSPSLPVDNASISISGLTNASVTVSITCPQYDGVSTIKETVTVNYGTPQKSVTNSVIVESVPDSCPTGFIVVPGSKTYGTSDFCVMKYEAKAGGNNIPISTPTGTPWVTISQFYAKLYSKNVADCPSCHLITEAEWMTIAQNVASVSENWSSGTVGSGYIFSGHNDNNPANMLAASTDDNDFYSGTPGTNSSNQKRTLTLTNGEVIWDFAGNAHELTSGVTTAGQPGVIGEPGYAYKEFDEITYAGSLPVNITPAYNGISGSENWDQTYDIGLIYSYAGDTTSKAPFRGGTYHSTNAAGIYGVFLSFATDSTAGDIGFRVAR